MKKRLQVFISSTFTDLADERQSAVEAALGSGHIPAGMELFKAGNRTQLETIYKWIDDSDVYMLILGGRYGSIDEASGKSYTHLEYEYAISKRKPVFAVILSDSFLKNKGFVDIGDKQKYQEFKALVMTRIVKMVNDSKDIMVEIYATLNDFIQEYELAGWVRGNNTHVITSPIRGCSLELERGNSIGNISNGGFLAAKDDWVYYCNPKDGYKLYKMRKDGTGRTRLNDSYSCFINIVGNWIYYTTDVKTWPDGKLYRMSLDGSNDVKLCDNYSGDVSIVGEWIYHSIQNGKKEDQGIYRTHLYGTNKARINYDKSAWTTVADGWIYYRNEEDDSKLYKVCTDGSNKTKLTDDRSACINIVDNWVYYCNQSEDGKLYKICTNGTSRKKLIDDYCWNINVAGGWVYYRNVSDGGALYRIRLDGTYNAKLNDVASSSCHIADEWLYYFTQDNGQLYKIRMDGSDCQSVV